MIDLRAATIVALVLTAGCVQKANEPYTPSILPADWQSGAALHPYGMSGDHGGGRGAALNPVQDLAPPASCRVYRDNETHERDSCEVEVTETTPTWRWPWVVRASWAACPTHDFGGCHDGDYPAPYSQRVVAFDEAGRPVAWWDGKAAPDTQYSTE